MTRTSDAFPTIRFATIVGFLLLCVAGTVASRNPRASAQKETSYLPLSVGNWWVYSLEGNSKRAGETSKWSVTQREIVHGAPVYHLWQTPALDDEPLSLVEVPGGIAEADTDRFLLKIPLHAGDRWSSSSRSLRARGTMDAFQVISVGKPCLIREHSFDDCVVIREVDEANNVASLTTYARGVGPVKYVYFKGLHSEEVDTTLTIKSWEVH